MNQFSNKKLTENAKHLRKEMTKEERHLWYDFLKSLDVVVHRQKVFEKYIADFYIASANIVIELDGSQHYEETGLSDDFERDCFFKDKGFTVLRYSNAEVDRNFRGVCEDILFHLGREV